MPGPGVCFHYCSMISPLYITARHAMHSTLGTSTVQVFPARLHDGGRGLLASTKGSCSVTLIHNMAVNEQSGVKNDGDHSVRCVHLKVEPRQQLCLKQTHSRSVVNDKKQFS